MRTALGILIVGLLAGCGPRESGELFEGSARVEKDQGLAAEALPDESAPLVVFLGDSLTAGYGLSEQEAFEVEQRHGMQVFASADAAEGPRAFLEKRKPVFTGK